VKYKSTSVYNAVILTEVRFHVSLSSSSGLFRTFFNYCAACVSILIPCSFIVKQYCTNFGLSLNLDRWASGSESVVQTLFVTTVVKQWFSIYGSDKQFILLNSLKIPRRFIKNVAITDKDIHLSVLWSISKQRVTFSTDKRGVRYVETSANLTILFILKNRMWRTVGNMFSKCLQFADNMCRFVSSISGHEHHLNIRCDYTAEHKIVLTTNRQMVQFLLLRKSINSILHHVFFKWCACWLLLASRIPWCAF